MTTVALSPSSVLASPVEVNPQVKTDLQTSTPQAAQDAHKVANTIQTDTLTISAYAVKMAKYNSDALVKETDIKK